MFDKFRRKSKELRATFATAGPSPPPISNRADSSPPVLKPIPTSFLDLPPELRNQIYELVANQVKSLTLISTSPKPTPPALFLVNHQIRSEYRPILLSRIPVQTHVHNFDFKPLMRSIGSFYSSELKALRANSHLVIHVQFEKFDPGKTHRDSLRRWAVKRSANLDRLPWSYRCSSPVKEGLVKGLMRVRQLMEALDENLRFELEPIELAIVERLRAKREDGVGFGGIDYDIAGPNFGRTTTF